MKEILADIQLLLECLRCQLESPSALNQALLAIANICCDHDEAKDVVRDCGGLDFVLELFTTQPAVRDAAMYTLGCAVERNVFSQRRLSTKSLFAYIAELLSDTTAGPSSARTLRMAAFLVLALVSNNNTGQILVRKSGCLDNLIELFKVTLPRSLLSCVDDSPSPPSDLANQELWFGVCSALGACVNNPQNEDNQRHCAVMFPHAFRVMEGARDPDVIRHTASLIGAATANNVHNQERVSRSGGLEVLSSRLYTLCTLVRSDMSPGVRECVQAVACCVDATVTDNEANSSVFGRLGGVQSLLQLVQTPTLSTPARLQAIVSLGHCTDNCGANQVCLVELGGLSVLIQQLTDTKDEELSHAVKFILQACVNTDPKHGQKVKTPSQIQRIQAILSDMDATSTGLTKSNTRRQKALPVLSRREASSPDPRARGPSIFQAPSRREASPSPNRRSVVQKPSEECLARDLDDQARKVRHSPERTDRSVLDQYNTEINKKLDLLESKLERMSRAEEPGVLKSGVSRQCQQSSSIAKHTLQDTELNKENVPPLATAAKKQLFPNNEMHFNQQTATLKAMESTQISENLIQRQLHESNWQSESAERFNLNQQAALKQQSFEASSLQSPVKSICMSSSSHCEMCYPQQVCTTPHCIHQSHHVHHVPTASNICVVQSPMKAAYHQCQVEPCQVFVSTQQPAKSPNHEFHVNEPSIKGNSSKKNTKVQEEDLLDVLSDVAEDEPEANVETEHSSLMSRLLKKITKRKSTIDLRMETANTDMNNNSSVSKPDAGNPMKKKRTLLTSPKDGKEKLEAKANSEKGAKKPKPTKPNNKQTSYLTCDTVGTQTPKATETIIPTPETQEKPSEISRQNPQKVLTLTQRDNGTQTPTGNIKEPTSTRSSSRPQTRSARKNVRLTPASSAQKRSEEVARELKRQTASHSGDSEKSDSPHQANIREPPQDVFLKPTGLPISYKRQRSRHPTNDTPTSPAAAPSSPGNVSICGSEFDCDLIRNAKRNLSCSSSTVDKPRQHRMNVPPPQSQRQKNVMITPSRRHSWDIKPTKRSVLPRSRTVSADNVLLGKSVRSIVKTPQAVAKVHRFSDGDCNREEYDEDGELEIEVISPTSRVHAWRRRNLSLSSQNEESLQGDKMEDSDYEPESVTSSPASGELAKHCPGCQPPSACSLPVLNSRTYTIAVETTCYTCPIHRFIRATERQYIQLRRREINDANGPAGLVSGSLRAVRLQSQPQGADTEKTGADVYDFGSSTDESSYLGEKNLTPPSESDLQSRKRTLRPPAGTPHPPAGSRKPRIPYSAAEETALVRGVATRGKHWTDILHSFTFHPTRTAVDLKDKYRRMTAKENAPLTRWSPPGVPAKPARCGRPFSMVEERRLRRGVRLYGHNWRLILNAYGFVRGRTAAELRDRWRVLNRGTAGQ